MPLGAGGGGCCVRVVVRGGGRSRGHRRAVRFARRSEQVPYVSEQRIERCWFGQEGISTRGSCAAELSATPFGRDDKIGTVRVVESRRRSSHSAWPSKNGRSISVSTRAGWHVNAFTRASRPSNASTTSHPICSSNCRCTAHVCWSGSTTRTRLAIRPSSRCNVVTDNLAGLKQSSCTRPVSFALTAMQLGFPSLHGRAGRNAVPARPISGFVPLAICARSRAQVAVRLAVIPSFPGPSRRLPPAAGRPVWLDRSVTADRGSNVECPCRASIYETSK